MSKAVSPCIVHPDNDTSRTSCPFPAQEDGILYPMADQVIPAGQHRAVLEGFAQVEHEETGEGVHEAYLALAEALAREAAG